MPGSLWSKLSSCASVHHYKHHNVLHITKRYIKLHKEIIKLTSMECIVELLNLIRIINLPDALRMLDVMIFPLRPYL